MVDKSQERVFLTTRYLFPPGISKSIRVSREIAHEVVMQARELVIERDALRQELDGVLKMIGEK